MRRSFLSVLLALFCIFVNAGDFAVSAKLSKVKQTGYYKIVLRPGVIAYSRPDYGDIRLLNDKGEEIPYIFKEESRATSITGFKEYPLMENQYQENKKSSRVVIHNKAKSLVSNLVLVIRNTDMVKVITLRGSDDCKNWYIIQKAVPAKMQAFDETSGAFSLQFPQVNYEYLELTTSDKKNDPIQFIRVGYFDSRISDGLYSAIPVKEFIQKDSSDKNSYITIRLDSNYEISKFHLTVSGPEYYRRRLIAGNFTSGTRREIFQSLGEYELWSGDNQSWNIEKIRTGELTLVIENADNKPLKVVDAKVYQLNKYLIARLDAGNNYFVATGNEKLNPPNYDLVYFSDSIPDSLTELETSEISVRAKKDNLPPDGKFTGKILWGVIVLIIGMLGFFSVRMIKEMGKKE